MRTLLIKLVSAILLIIMFTLSPSLIEMDSIQASRANSIPTPTLNFMHVWKVLLLIYHNTNVTYIDSDGTNRHLYTSLSDAEMLKAQWAFQQYTSIANDFSSQEALVDYDIVHITRPITSISYLGDAGYWVSPSDVMVELDQYAQPGSYDSVFVHWAQCNPDFSQCVPSRGWGRAYRATDWSHGATYATVANAPDWAWKTQTVGEIWLHEWLHGVCSYYADLGYTMPEGDADGASSHGYLWSSITGWGEYYRDLMTGRVLENGELTGIPAEAWQYGTILDQSAYIFADYFYTDTLASYQQTGVIVWDSTSQTIRTGGFPGVDSRMYAPVEFASSFILEGRVYIPATGIGPYDSIAVALRNNQVEYWGTLAYGTELEERNHISIMRNDNWGDLYPMTFNSGWYTVKMQVDQSTMLIRMKVWADGTNEPKWQTSRVLDTGWKATGIGFRHFGNATTWFDDLFAIESSYQISYRVYLPAVATNH